MVKRRILRSSVGESRRLKGRSKHVLSLLVVFLLLASLAIIRDGSLFGFSFVDKSDENTVVVTDSVCIVNTTHIGSEFIGYAGPVPVELYITGGKIDSVKPLPNKETESFFTRIEEAGLIDSWNGKSLEEAASLKVDAVTGATYSSRALIGNVRTGISYAMDNDVVRPAGDDSAIYWKSLMVILVIAGGAIIPLFVHNKVYRVIQQFANVGVLGFWAGTFLDYAVILNLFANGAVLTLASIIICLLMFVAILYPVLGRGTHYCAWICPYGSMQDLAGGLSRVKLKISPDVVRMFDGMRMVLWGVLLILLYLGIGADWIDHEIFTMFIVHNVSLPVLIIGITFIVLSVFVPRPFCRFVCPTGSLLKLC